MEAAIIKILSALQRAPQGDVSSFHQQAFVSEARYESSLRVLTAAVDADTLGSSYTEALERGCVQPLGRIDGAQLLAWAQEANKRDFNERVVARQENMRKSAVNERVAEDWTNEADGARMDAFAVLRSHYLLERKKTMDVYDDYQKSLRDLQSKSEVSKAKALQELDSVFTAVASYVPEENSSFNDGCWSMFVAREQGDGRLTPSLTMANLEQAVADRGQLIRKLHIAGYLRESSTARQIEALTTKGASGLIKMFHRKEEENLRAALVGTYLCGIAGKQTIDQGSRPEKQTREADQGSRPEKQPREVDQAGTGYRSEA